MQLVGPVKCGSISHGTMQTQSSAASKSEETSRGIRTIYGMSGAESIPFLKKAIAELESMDEDLSETERSEYEEKGVTGYWIPTRKNAIRPLYQLLAFAQMRPRRAFGRGTN